MKKTASDKNIVSVIKTPHRYICGNRFNLAEWAKPTRNDPSATVESENLEPHPAPYSCLNVIYGRTQYTSTPQLFVSNIYILILIEDASDQDPRTWNPNLRRPHPAPYSCLNVIYRRTQYSSTPHPFLSNIYTLLLIEEASDQDPLHSSIQATTKKARH